MKTVYNKSRRKESIVMSEMHEQVQEVLEKLRPFLLRDGGDL